jgi:ABC-type sulfate transport system substrate-binding protein
MDNFSQMLKNGRSIPRWLIWTVVLGVFAAALFFLLRWTLMEDDLPLRLNIYAFSTQEEVMTQGIIPAFKRSWEEKTGKGVEVETVFGPSVILASQINLGAPADIALFSNAQQVNWLKIGKKVSKNSAPILYGFTPIVIATQPGNPGNISDYHSLTQPGSQDHPCGPAQLWRWRMGNIG